MGFAEAPQEAGCQIHRIRRRVSFVATYKRILLDVIREKGIELTPEAVTKLETLPATFKEFRSALTTAHAPKEGGREARKPDLGIQTAERPVPALPVALVAAAQ